MLALTLRKTLIFRLVYIMSATHVMISLRKFRLQQITIIAHININIFKSFVVTPRVTTDGSSMLMLTYTIILTC